MDSTTGMQHEGGSEKSMWLDTKMCAKEMAAPRVLQKDLEKGKSCNPGQMKVFKITEVKNNIRGRTEVTLQEIAAQKNQVIVLKVGSSLLASLKNTWTLEPMMTLNKALPGQSMAKVYQNNKTKASSFVSLTDENNRIQTIQDATFARVESDVSPSLTKELLSDTPRLGTVDDEMKSLLEKNKDKLVESVSVFKEKKAILVVYGKGPEKRKYDDGNGPHIRDNKIIKLGMNRNPTAVTVPMEEFRRNINHPQPIASDKAQLSRLPPRFQVKAGSKKVSESILQSLRKRLPELSINGSHSKTASAVSQSSRPMLFTKPNEVVLKPVSRKMRSERDVLVSPKSDERCHRPLHIFPDSPPLSHELKTQSDFITAKTSSVSFDDSKCATPNPIVNNKNAVDEEYLIEFQFEAIDGQKFVFSRKFSAAKEEAVADDIGSISFCQEVAIQQEGKDETRPSTITTELCLSPESRDDESLLYSESETSGFDDCYDHASSSSGVESKTRRKFFPKESVDVLWNWFNTHKTHPYPNQEETTALAHDSDLSIQQVKGWFYYTRKKLTTVISSCSIRPAYSPQSVNVLKQWFNTHKTNPYPNQQETTTLAQDSGLSFKQVKRWFNNIRTKLTTGISSCSSRRQAHNPQSVNVLKQWFNNHTNCPYPDKNETIELANKTGMSYAQIQTWCRNARLNVTKNLVQQQQKSVD